MENPATLSFTDCYCFTLSEGRLILLDPTGVDGSVSWMLERFGEPVRAGVWENADSDRLLYLQAGEYIPRLNGPNPAQAAFILDASPVPASAPIEPGVPVSALLSPGDSLQAHTFEAAADERYFFDGLAAPHDDPLAGPASGGPGVVTIGDSRHGTGQHLGGPGGNALLHQQP
ncbi:MAG: hypothetical protein LBE85_10205 [Candidatus Accumulibacter sp.]|nr:hypothetical protein [Accumulibacter sp.]